LVVKEAGRKECGPKEAGRKKVALLLGAAAVLMAVAHPLGARLAAATHLIVLRRVFGFPLVFVGLVAALAAEAVWRGSRREWLRVTVAAGASFVLLGCLLFGLIAGAGWDGPHRLRMTTASGEDFLVDLDPATAEPRAPVSVG
jgi:hypothetical protein